MNRAFLIKADARIKRLEDANPGERLAALEAAVAELRALLPQPEAPVVTEGDPVPKRGPGRPRKVEA